jgi:hypothetical protein
LEIATNKTVFGFAGTDHLRAKIIINDKTPDQVSQFTTFTAAYLTKFPTM